MGNFGGSAQDDGLAGFLPDEVRELLTAGRGKELEPREREITGWFGSLTGFVSLGEQLEPDAYAALIGEALGEVEDAVRRNRGIVDKFMGDATMALWNVPQERPGHQADACLAALDCVEALRRVSERLGSPDALRMRVGIASGRAVAGVLRFGSRRQYTALGDEVNLASRLEGANKFFRTDILVSEAVARHAGDRVVARPVGAVRVVGRAKPLAVFHVLGRKGRLPPPWEKALPIYLEALEHFQARRFDDAAPLFGQVLALVSGDGPSRLLSTIAEDYAAVSPPPDWDGAINLTGS